MQDVIIIGGGPAGCAAAVYAARKLLKTILITEEFGGQSAVSTDIQNWIGTPHIAGADFAKSLEAHVREYAADVVTIEAGARVTKVVRNGETFTVAAGDKTYEARTVLVTAGGRRRQLGVPGADTFEHKGVTYCASCDGPVFSGQDVAVIGGGNAAFETAAQLLAYCKSVTLLSRSDFRADPSTVAAVLKNPHMKALTGIELLSVTGEKFVTGLTYRDSTGDHTLAVTGIFAEIGMEASTDFVAELVDRDQTKRIVVDPRNQRTSLTGVWAAGDCTDGLYHQNNIAAGDAVKALEDIYLYLKA